MADASYRKVDRASEVAKAMNVIKRFESTDQGHLLGVVEDNEQQSEDSDLDSGDNSEPEMDVPHKNKHYFLRFIH